VFHMEKNASFSNRYFFISVFFILLYSLVQMNILLFLSIGTFFLYSIESRFGKVGVLPFLFLIAISPALHYAVSVFTFTLRLQLSEYASFLLNSVGFKIM